MGQKVNPHGMRVGVIDDWDSKWFAEKDYAALLVEDAKIRQFLKKHLFAAGISKIGIKRVRRRWRRFTTPRGTGGFSGRMPFFSRRAALW